MRCKNAQILINEYLDGTLGEAKRKALFAHIDSCAHCKEELEQLAILKSALKSLPDEEPPKGLLSGAILKAKFDRADVPEKKVRYFPRSAIAGIAAAMVITVGAFWYFSNSMQYSQSPAADFAASKAQTMTAMEEAAEAPAPLMQAAPQLKAAPAASSAAAASSMAPAASEAPRSAAGINESQDSVQAARIEIIIETDKVKSFKEDFTAFIDKNKIITETQDLESMETVLFLLNEPLLPEFESLMKKHKVEQPQISALPANILIAFIKS